MTQPRLESIFQKARQMADPERAAYLQGACSDDTALRSRVEAMLAADDETSLLPRSGRDEEMTMTLSAGPSAGGSPREQPGEQVGRYKLLEQIGEGGFGTVWAAEQREPVKRRVALKIIKLGMDTKQVIARFEAERQALAMMDHPNIAKVLDAGSTETGRPYFAMELVKGVPILAYCDREKLDTKARLDLFMKVCHAIQHAHQKGIIHRDIKPSNVLVTMHDGVPVPKVIDFGIAKATNQELTEKTIYTQHHQMIGTPAYMSPEQAEMSGLDIDTRSDIYSLGVLLYELLTGTTPLDSQSLMEAGFAEMMRIIRETEPHKPSTRLSSLGETGTRTAQLRRADVQKLSTLLRGDLDWIVMKCLEKDRTRRYETANGLAADIERHLNDEPVTAGPPSARYRLSKFVKRNRGHVVAVGAIAVLLVLGVVGTSYGMVWVLREKSRADTEATKAIMAARAEGAAKLDAQASERHAIDQAERAEAAEADALARAEELELVADFQSEQLGAIDPQVMGINIRRSLLDAVPEDRREALDSAFTGINFTDLARITLEDNIFERTIKAIDAQFAKQPLVLAQLLQSIADTMRELGLLDLANDPQERALAIRRERLGDDHPDTLASIHNLGILRHIQGELREAEGYYRTALEGRRRVLGDDHPDTLKSIDNLSGVLQEQARLDEAEAYSREALEGRRRVLGDDHPSTLTSVGNMGALLQSQGRLAEAEPYLGEALEGRRRVLGNDHPDTLAGLGNMGGLLYALQGPAEAEPYFREALEGSRRVLGNDHPKTLDDIMNMGVVLQMQGRIAEAEPYLREAVEGFRRVLGSSHPKTLNSMGNLGVFLVEQGRLEESEPYWRESAAGLRRALGDDHPETLTAISNLGYLLQRQGKLGEAESCFREAMEGNGRVLGNNDPSTAISINNLGFVLQAQGRLDEAEPYYREALEIRRRVLGDDHPGTLTSVNNLALLLADLGRGEEALQLADEAVETGRRVLGDESSQVGDFIGKRARALQALERYAEAAEAGREAYAILAAALGDEHKQTRRVVGYLADIYDEWNVAEPDAGHDASAAQWRAKLENADEGE